MLSALSLAWRESALLFDSGVRKPWNGLIGGLLTGSHNSPRNDCIMIYLSRDIKPRPDVVPFSGSGCSTHLYRLESPKRRRSNAVRLDFHLPSICDRTWEVLTCCQEAAYETIPTVGFDAPSNRNKPDPFENACR